MSFMLPEASGGDTISKQPDDNFPFDRQYAYTVTGLPPGFVFDEPSRTVSGTPTANGFWTVTYSADDADSDTSASDTAVERFTITVGANSAPKLLDENCNDHVGDGPVRTVELAFNMSKDVGPLMGAAGCSDTPPKAPLFDDDDSETLSFTGTLAENKFVEVDLYSLSLPQGCPTEGCRPDGVGKGSIRLKAGAAREARELRLDLTATDARGASVSTHVTFIVPSFSGTGAKPSLTKPADLTFALNEAMADQQRLPAASGGDRLDLAPGMIGKHYTLPEDSQYAYALTGLPPGLVFDPATRKVSGTPTSIGTFTVTYTAEDADTETAATGHDDLGTAEFTITVTNGAGDPGTPPPTAVAVALVDDGKNLVGAHAPTGFVVGGVLQFTITFQAAETGPIPPDRFFVLNWTNVASGTTSPPKIVFPHESTSTPRSPDTQAVSDAGAWKVCIRRGATGRNPNPGCATVTVLDPLDAPSASSVDGDKLKLTFDGPLDEDSVPPSYAFSVWLDGSAQTPLGVSVRSGTVTLALHPAARAGQSVTLSYGRFTGKPLRGGHRGIDVASFSGLSVANATEDAEDPGDAPPAWLPGNMTWVKAGINPGSPHEPDADAATGNAEGEIVVRWWGAGSGPKPTKWIVETRRHGSDDEDDFETAAELEAGDDRAGTLRLIGLTPGAGYDVRLTAEITAGVTYYTMGAENVRAGADTTAPRFERATVEGDTLAVSFTEALDRRYAPNPNYFSVGGRARETTVTAVRFHPVLAGRVELTLTPPVSATETGLTVSYLKGRDPHPLRDRSGNRAVDFTDEPVQNNTLGAAPLLLVDAGVNGKWLWMDFDQALDPDSVPATASITCMQGTTALATQSLYLIERGVRATLANRAAGGKTVRCVYDPAAAGGDAKKLKSADTMVAALSETFDPRNIRPANNPHVIDVDIVSDPGSDDAYGLGDTIRVRLTYDVPVDVRGTIFHSDHVWQTPHVKIVLGPGGGARWASYEGGAGTDELVFGYQLTYSDMTPVGEEPGGVAVVASSLSAYREVVRKGHGGWADIPGNSWAPTFHGGLDHDPEHKVGVAGTVADAWKPRLLGATVTGSLLTLTFDEALDETSAPPGAAFTVLVEAEDRVTQEFLASGSSIAGGRVNVALPAAVAHDATVTFSYAQEDAAGSVLKDKHGNAADDIEGAAVVNNTLAPGQTVASGKFVEVLAAGNNPPRPASVSVVPGPKVGQITVEWTPGSVTPTRWRIHLRKSGINDNFEHIAESTNPPDHLSFTIFRTFEGGEKLLEPGAAYDIRIRFSKGGLGVTYDALGVIALAAPGEETGVKVPIVKDTAMASNPGADGVYGIGDRIAVKLVFSEPVAVTGTPRVEIDTDIDPGAAWSRQWAVYESGGGTDELVFATRVRRPPSPPASRYPVVPFHSRRGVAVLPNSLELQEGGAIVSVANEQPAKLGHAGLGRDAAHRVDADPPDERDVVLNGRVVTITFDEALDPDSLPSANAFFVGQDNAGHDGNRERIVRGESVEIVDNTVTVRLEEPPSTILNFFSATLHLYYYDPGRAAYSGELGDFVRNVGEALRDRAGNRMGQSPACQISECRIANRPVHNHTRHPVLITRAQWFGVEGEDLEFEVALDKAAGFAGAKVDYETVDGTAEAGTDYTRASGTLEYQSGERVKTVRVETLADGVAEGEETMTLRLSNARGMGLAGNAELTGRIRDPGSAPPAEDTAIVSDPGERGTYGLGDTIRVAVRFNEALEVDTGGRHAVGEAEVRPRRGLSQEGCGLRERQRHAGAGVRVRAGGAAEPVYRRRGAAGGHAGAERRGHPLGGERRGRRARPPRAGPRPGAPHRQQPSGAVGRVDRRDGAGRDLRRGAGPRLDAGRERVHGDGDGRRRRKPRDRRDRDGPGRGRDRNGDAGVRHRARRDGDGGLRRARRIPAAGPLRPERGGGLRRARGGEPLDGGAAGDGDGRGGGVRHGSGRGLRPGRDGRGGGDLLGSGHGRDRGRRADAGADRGRAGRESGLRVGLGLGAAGV